MALANAALDGERHAFDPRSSRARPSVEREEDLCGVAGTSKISVGPLTSIGVVLSPGTLPRASGGAGGGAVELLSPTAASAATGSASMGSPDGPLEGIPLRPSSAIGGTVEL